MRANGSRAISLVLAVVVTVMVCAFCRAGDSGSSLDLESRKFVDVAIVAIVSHWSVDELLKRASPEMLAESEHQVDVNSLFNEWRPLGGLISYIGSTGGARIIESPEIGRMITANYTARAIFQNGTAEIAIELVKREGNWSILAFKVNLVLRSNRSV